MKADEIEVGESYLLQWDSQEVTGKVVERSLSPIATEEGCRAIFSVDLEDGRRLTVRPSLFLRKTRNPVTEPYETCEEYVALWHGNDGALGRTIKCDSWEQAVAQCVQIAAECGVVMTNEHTARLEETGDCKFDDDSWVHIGGLELPIPED